MPVSRMILARFSQTRRLTSPTEEPSCCARRCSTHSMRQGMAAGESAQPWSVSTRMRSGGTAVRNLDSRATAEWIEKVHPDATASRVSPAAPAAPVHACRTGTAIGLCRSSSSTSAVAE